MAKNTQTTLDSYYGDLHRHYTVGFQETDRRRTGKGRIGSISFDESDELFRSWIDESKWPYDSLLFDPRVFTFVFEKTARLLGSRLRGELIPREGGDVLKAQINNSILDYQWDQANRGGPMLSKWALMDINTRKYGAAFALCKWRHEVDKDGRVVFDGPDMQVLNNRDVAHDPNATSMENCSWLQVREYLTIEDLKRVNDTSKSGPIYENLDQLTELLRTRGQGGGDERASNWISRNRTISGLQTVPMGDDPVFKRIEITTEFRRDEWFTFAPKHGLVLRKTDNPYKNFEIPALMLRYYVVDDDMYGLSEIEPVKSLQKAINALLCQYVDEINMKLYTPVAIGPGVRQHTLEWGKGSRWVMNNPMTDFRLVESQSSAAAYFNNTYSALVAAMMNALGESSLGVSNIDRYQADKTATEVKHLVSQRNARDNFNQMYLAEAIERQMKLWHSMNQKMLFQGRAKQQFILRIAGKDAVKYFEESDMTKKGLSESAAMSANEDMNVNPDLIAAPHMGVNTGTEDKPNIVPKFSSERGVGKLYVEPSDLLGDYDYVADVKTMSLNAGEEERISRDRAVTALLTNPNVVTMLAQDQVKPKFKDLFVAWLEDSGFKDADKYFEAMPLPQAPVGPDGAPMGGPQGSPPTPGTGEPKQEAQSVNQTGLPGQPGSQVPNINLNSMNQELLNRQVMGATAPRGIPNYGQRSAG